MNNHCYAFLNCIQTDKIITILDKLTVNIFEGNNHYSYSLKYLDIVQNHPHFNIYIYINLYRIIII